jgi:hypothetical protein
MMMMLLHEKINTLGSLSVPLVLGFIHGHGVFVLILKHSS